MMKCLVVLIFSMFFMCMPMASAAQWVPFVFEELEGRSDLSVDYFDADSVLIQQDAAGQLVRLYYWEKRIYPASAEGNIDCQIGLVRYDREGHHSYDALMYSHFVSGSELFQKPKNWTDRGAATENNMAGVRKAGQVMEKELERGKNKVMLNRIRQPLLLDEVDFSRSLLN